MADEPDLMAELDDAELIMSGEAAEVRTEWGVRWTDEAGTHIENLSKSHGQRGEEMARALVKPYPYRQPPGNSVTLKKRKIIVGPWQDA